jgi:hypothetical protein
MLARLLAVGGFNRSTPLFSITDVGSAKEAADAKIRGSRLYSQEAYSYQRLMARCFPFSDNLGMFARMTSTKLVFFAGSHDNGYSHAVSALETEGLTDKIVIIKGNGILFFSVQSVGL